MRTDEYKNIFTHQQSLWWYRGMAVINTRLLQKFLIKKSRNRILDAGCGTGAAFGYLKDFGDVVGVDVSDDALTLVRSLHMGKVKKADIIDMPFSNNTFDAIVCLDVLYHRWVGDYRKAIGEFKRVLNPRGILFTREPAFNWLRGSHDRVDFTKHRFSKKEMEQELVLAGFQVKKISYANFFLFPLVLVKRIPQMLLPSRHAASDMRAVHPILDRLLFSFLLLESKLVDIVSFPWGSSLLCVAQKP